MSDTTPAAGQPREPGDEPAVDYLEDPRPARSRSGRRWAIVGAAAAGLLGVAGAGAWGVSQLMGGGAAPATAVPGDALAYLSLDLDPSAGQKVAALQTLRKFPALREHLGVTGGDDLRRWLYEGLTADAPCDDLDFARDVDPWLGSRIAVAVLPGDAEPLPVGVIQVKDREAASAGVARIAACGDEPEPGTAFAGDYLLVAESDAVAREAAADAEESSLAGDDGFQRWVDEAGGAGVVTGYVAAEAARTVADSMLRDLHPAMPGAGPSLMRSSLADFQGAALVMRFDDGAFQVETAAGLQGLPETGSATGDGGLSDLPASTAIALGAAVPDHAAEDLLDAMTAAGPGADAMLQQWAAAAGLSLPGDLQTLLGDGVSVAVDSTVDLEAVIDGSAAEASTVPAGIRIAGDPAAIRPVLDKVTKALGASPDDVAVASGEHGVAVGLDPDYVATLAGDGDLGDQDAFAAALPEVTDGSATGGLFVDFDAGDWLTSFLDGDEATEEAKANAEPLSTLGVTGRVDGDVAHLVLRLTTD